MKIHSYIDGFNLYYGALKGTPYKWLDLWKFCERLVPRTCEIERVNYFTAKAHAQPGNRGVRERQRIYLAALRNHIPGIDIVYGQFRAHAAAMKLLTPGGALEQRELTRKGNQIARINSRIFDAMPGWQTDPGPTVHVIKIEEKGSEQKNCGRTTDSPKDQAAGHLRINAQAQPAPQSNSRNEINQAQELVNAHRRYCRAYPPGPLRPDSGRAGSD